MTEDEMELIEPGTKVIPVRANNLREAIDLVFSAMGFDKQLIHEHEITSMTWIGCASQGSYNC